MNATIAHLYLLGFVPDLLKLDFNLLDELEFIFDCVVHYFVTLG